MWTRDNLDVLRGLNSESIDLVYADPPFNSNKNYEAPIGSKAAGAAFKDTWTLRDVDLAWHGEIAEREPKVYAAIDKAGIVHGRMMFPFRTHRLAITLAVVLLAATPVLGASAEPDRELEVGGGWFQFDPLDIDDFGSYQSRSLGTRSSRPVQASASRGRGGGTSGRASRGCHADPGPRGASK